MKKIIFGIFALLAFVVVAVPAYAKPMDKVNICHYDADTMTYHLINVSENAKTAHMNHGDGIPGGNVPNLDLATFGTNCEVNITLPSTPVIFYPVNNVVQTSAEQDKIDWYDSTGTYTPMTYKYEAYANSDYTGLIYASSWLTASEIPTPGTPADEYYIRVMAKDNMGNMSAWSNGASDPYKITIQNPVRYTRTLGFNPTGWAGWSCPLTEYAVGKGVLVGTANTYLWEPGATAPGVSYPNTPFGYTYGEGETGMLIQNDGDGNETITFYVDCMPNK